MPDDLHARLVAALQARLEVARAATPGPWYALANGSVTHAGHEVSLHGSRWGMYVVASTGAHSTRKPSDPDARHIAATDPATEIRRVEALLEAGDTLATLKWALENRMKVDVIATLAKVIRDLAAGEGIEVGE